MGGRFRRSSNFFRLASIMLAVVFFRVIFICG
jgi:hypothetical protein